MPCRVITHSPKRYMPISNAAGLAEDRKGFLFRTARGHNGHRALRQTNKPARRLADDPAPRGRGRHHGGNWVPHVPRDGDYGLPLERRRARARSGNGGARKPAHDQAVRQDERAAHPGRGREDPVVRTTPHASKVNPLPPEKAMDLLNRQLSAVNPQYSARFVPAPDESVDDEIQILLAGAKTRWAIQIGDGDFVVNEYGFDANGELEWVKSHAMVSNLKRAGLALCGLLEHQP
jgi:hypothetical protein